MKKSHIVIIVLTFICFTVWFIADLFKTPASVQVTPELQEALEPLNPSFDQSTLDQISQIDGGVPTLNLRSTPPTSTNSSRLIRRPTP